MSNVSLSSPDLRDREGPGSRVVVESLESRVHLAATLPAGFAESAYVGGLTQPSAQVFAPDGRLFIIEKAGRVRVFSNGTLTTALTIPVDTYSERGLDGIALDPNFRQNGHVYLYYTTRDPQNPNTPNNNAKNRLSRFTISSSNPNLINPASEVVLVNNIPSDGGNHNGGSLAFDTNGFLYLGIGDAGNSANAQNLNAYNGKILRLRPQNYPNNIVPSDNPFVGPNAIDAVWAYGFRNPYSAAIDPVTNKLFVNDVGSLTWEEINDVQKGKNYGWPASEGPTTNPAYVGPVHAYNHNGTGAAITGGAFYNANQFPASYKGTYFFADYVDNFVRTLNVTTKAVTSFATNLPSPVDLDVGPDGSLYSLSFFNGTVTKLSYTANANRAPTAVASATPTQGNAPLTVQFSGNGSSDPDGDALTYSWSFGDGTTATGQNVSHTYNSNGQYTATLTVRDNRGGSDPSNPIEINVGNFAPTGTIGTPTSGTLYSGGQTISFSGTATDPEDGTLPASAFRWDVVFHHNTHTHPFINPIIGARSGSFTIPTGGETDPDQWYRITLTVTDSDGRQHQSTRDVRPRTSNLTLASNVNGLTLNLDGQPQTAPDTTLSVAGQRRSISAPSTQVLNGRTYQFVSWSDNGAATHDITVPTSNTTYTATYREVASGTTVTKSAIADAYVRGGTYASQNFGSSTVLETKNNPGSYERYTYLKFDLSNVSVSSIANVKLRAFGKGQAAGDVIDVTAHGITDTFSWTEAGLTWNNKPTFGWTIRDTKTVRGATGQYYEWDLTQYIRNEKNAGRNLISVVLKNPQVTEHYAAFNSDEAASNKPQLVITTTTAAPSVAAASASVAAAPSLFSDTPVARQSNWSLIEEELDRRGG